MNTKDKQLKIEEVLKRGVIKQVLPTEKEFKDKMMRKKLRFYIGADPTSTALHLSHAKNYMILEEFRQLGHEVIVLIGDFTARIGDPSGRDSQRAQLTREDVVKNVDSWLKQIKPLMDFTTKDNPPKVMYNHDWLAKLTMEDVVSLASNVTVQQMLERDMFAKRIKEEKPIYLHEFLYPLMQGYDSVAMEVDVELCGTDQIFNALVGRTLLKKLKNKEKFVVAVNLMENPVTGELMSKSKGTGIFLDFSASDMYGAIMAQPDEMTKVFFINNTRVPLSEIASLEKELSPKDLKMKAAYEVVKVFHGEEGALKSQTDFVARFQKKEIPDEMPEIMVKDEANDLQSIVKQCLPEESMSNIRRLIEQGGVKLEGKEVKKDVHEKIIIDSDGIILKVGKRKWFKMKK
ncbi:MAG TPA: tyrosine--tRNA ligase [Patescibacteria group bacterium]|nr:tyrosine--tRNA ligase [Patescibacteria group bacterium]